MGVMLIDVQRILHGPVPQCPHPDKADAGGFREYSGMCPGCLAAAGVLSCRMDPDKDREPGQ
jgi:hypothetical protein